jgi:hypothetical protein
MRLARKGEHGRLIEPVGPVNDGKPVALQRDVREDIQPGEAALEQP